MTRMLAYVVVGAVVGAAVFGLALGRDDGPFPLGVALALGAAVGVLAALWTRAKRSMGRAARRAGAAARRSGP